MPDITVPDYYAQFSCIGPKCEDTCCSGWSVVIDRTTYHHYSRSKDPVLAPLFKLALRENTGPSAADDTRFGVLNMKADKGCHFQQADKLCAIHAILGEKSLSDTCRLYPRYLNQFGAQREKALGISCPEAARLILLNPEPMRFGTMAPEPAIDVRPFTSYRFPLQSDGDPAQLAVLNDFRALIIAILQCRDLSLGARMMLLGWLLEDANRVVSCETFGHASELLPVLEGIVGMLAHAPELEKQFAQIQPDMARKLEVMTQLIGKILMAGASPRFGECLLAAAEGLTVQEGLTDAALLQQYTRNYETYYQPFFQERAYIFENYLVNMVITRLFPFVRGSYLDLYRELVFNLSLLQVLLVGMAAKHQGLTEERVVQLFQSFSRKSDHNRSHLDNLIETLQVGAQDSFAHVMWMLKEVAPLATVSGGPSVHQ